MTAFRTDVPAHDLSVILARPTDVSITVSLSIGAAGREGPALVEYWVQGESERRTSPPVALRHGSTALVELHGLRPGTEYAYRVGVMEGQEDALKCAHGEPLRWNSTSRFRTRPAPGVDDGFTFVIQADSHLDQGVDPQVYERTLASMLAGSPDFMIDLGDTFMTDKRGQDFQSTLPQYDAQRYYFGITCHAAPLFMVLGNHDGEKGTSGRAPTDIGPLSYVQLTSRFPAPMIDGVAYSGSTAMADGVGSNHYAFEWGDALLIVLDPFWPTTDRIRGGRNGTGGGAGGPGLPPRPDGQPLRPVEGSWASTLGRAQYDWLAGVLSTTTASHRFVFIHHLVGGVGGAESRGGVESSQFFEWGGRNADGTPGLADRRPGWPLPIHDLLERHRVAAVFHGHDHLYVHGQRDGIHYQCVPQPGNPRGSTRSAAEYGYASGRILAGPGHVRVRVMPEVARVEFVRTDLAGGSDSSAAHPPAAGGTVVDAYEIARRPPPAPVVPAASPAAPTGATTQGPLPGP